MPLGLLPLTGGFTIPLVADDEYEDYRPSISESLRNWKHWDGPFREKVRLTAKNEWRKLRTFKNCCGNIDEPGC